MNKTQTYGKGFRLYVIVNGKPIRISLEKFNRNYGMTSDGDTFDNVPVNGLVKTCLVCVETLNRKSTGKVLSSSIFNVMFTNGKIDLEYTQNEFRQMVQRISNPKVLLTINESMHLSQLIKSEVK